MYITVMDHPKLVTQFYLCLPDVLFVRENYDIFVRPLVCIGSYSHGIVFKSLTIKGMKFEIWTILSPLRV